MPAHQDLPPELRHAVDRDDLPPRQRSGSRLLGGPASLRLVAWVVIGAMFLVPLLVSLAGLLGS